MPVAFAALFLTCLLAAGLAGVLSLAVFAVYATVSLAAFIAYGLDKSAARRKLRRTPESTLHALGVAGGWPGALAAQFLFRHKTSKQSFQVMFWVTAGVNCAALALLFLSGRV
ncbi:DUF1294 domain-containing protein [Noviherbaspirillum sp. ST9]|uniref:DUF1294 domain-containing protein n=1 Tax=Noviherbaspirillum sp. ST9 TaxID=3401606 RepID=UPI003B587AEA